MQTAPKLPGIRSAVPPMQVQIISFLRAAPVSQISLCSLKNAPKEEQCSLHNHHPAGFSHAKAPQIYLPLNLKVLRGLSLICPGCAVTQRFFKRTNIFFLFYLSFFFFPVDGESVGRTTRESGRSLFLRDTPGMLLCCSTSQSHKHTKRFPKGSVALSTRRPGTKPFPGDG